MIIAQISDTHIALDSPDADERIRDLERTIEDINTLDPVPDAIVHTGDVVHNGLSEEYARALDILGRARAPVFALVGNKDDRANFGSAFARAGFVPADSRFVDYTVEEYAVRLIAVDTLDPGSNKGAFCPARAERARRMIDAETTKPIAFFAHHPPFEVLVGPDRFHFGTPEAMQRLRDVIGYSGRVVAVFGGHVHRGTAGAIGSVKATVMPSVATPLRKGEYPPRMAACPVYHIHRFDPAGWFSTESRIVA